MIKDIDLQYMLLSIALTMLFVGFIGFERQRKHKVAGMTTHVLVALGACVLAIVQEKLYFESVQFALDNPEIAGNVIADRQRILAALITGVGFLGTGAIIKTNGNVHGLTTASTLWIVAIIGLVFGLGFYVMGIIISIAAIFTLVFIKKVFREKVGQ
jgi:putative Mg2+ transporter-C (MgtC) family protein